MKRLRDLLPFLLLASATAAAAQPSPVIYEGGQVWTKNGFVPRTLAVANGRFVDPVSVGTDARRVSVAGLFITPGYSNAHAHVTNPTEQSSRGFTDAGIFYVWNPNTITVGASGRQFFQEPGRYRLKVAQGGITEPGGHPERLYVEYLAPSVYGGRPRDWFIGNAFHFGTTRAEIDSALAELVRQRADFVKIYLLNSERYAAIRDDRRFYGNKGLNPANVPYLVRQAHQRGLKVAAHVETAHDLSVAARAGVDFAAHLPAYGDKAGPAARITPEIARLVARSRMRLIPTYALANGGDRYRSNIGDKERRVIAVQTENLRVLREAGALLLIGTDGFNQIFSETEHLVKANGLGPKEVAAALFGTARFLFPEREVACFENGCEADFLVLAADPTTDITALRRIERRVLGGIELPAPVPAAAP
jgi:imidazolonepropionase-like amidohydrolase